MKNIKYIIALLALVAIPAVSLAVWSAPTAAPTGDNTQPPLNVSAVDQEKGGTITAKGFCIRLNSTTIRCLGETPGDTPSVFDFPWIQNGTNIVNTNTGNVLANPARITQLWGTATEKLTVGGKVKAEGFCLGQSCIDINTGGAGDTVNNWKEAIINIIGGGGGTIGGSGTAGTLTKFTGATTLGDSIVSEINDGNYVYTTTPSSYAGYGSSLLSGVPKCPCDVSPLGAPITEDCKLSFTSPVQVGTGTKCYDSHYRLSTTYYQIYTMTPPGKTLSINGTVAIKGGNPGAGKILSSDATGLASWKTAAELGLGGGGGTVTINNIGATDPLKGTAGVLPKFGTDGTSLTDSWIKMYPKDAVNNRTLPEEVVDIFTQEMADDMLRNRGVVPVTNIWGRAQVTGQFKYVNGSQGEDKILVSDSTGAATWKTAAELGLGAGGAATGFRVESGKGVTPNVCSGSTSSGDTTNFCSVPRYIDIAFSKPFDTVPHVIVSAEDVSAVAGCVGMATDRVVARAENITKTGFRLVAAGSPVSGSCSGYDGYFTLAKASWVAVGGGAVTTTTGGTTEKIVMGVFGDTERLVASAIGATIDKTYTAQTDGIATAVTSGPNCSGALVFDVINDRGDHIQTQINSYGSMALPVKKGKNWRVYAQGISGCNFDIHWTPIVSGGTTGGTTGVTLPSCSINQIIKWSGSAWVCADQASTGVISYSNLPIGTIAGECIQSGYRAALSLARVQGTPVAPAVALTDTPGAPSVPYCGCQTGWRAYMESDPTKKPSVYENGIARCIKQ